MDQPDVDQPADTYGNRWAEIYDDEHSSLLPSEGQLSQLAALAGGGRVLELGIGTGRVALALAARGVEVEGLDASPAMVARLRAKPGADALAVVIGDMAEPDVVGPFRLVYVVFNTFFGLLTQARQLSCFRSVAELLEPDGVFLLEEFHALAMAEAESERYLNEAERIRAAVDTGTAPFGPAFRERLVKLTEQRDAAPSPPGREPLVHIGLTRSPRWSGQSGSISSDEGPAGCSAAAATMSPPWCGSTARVVHAFSPPPRRRKARPWVHSFWKPPRALGASRLVHSRPAPRRMRLLADEGLTAGAR